MRKKLRLIRESIERKNSAYLPEDSYLKKGKRENRNSIEEDGYLPDGTYPTDGGQRSRDVPRCLATSPKEESSVMRLMLGDKSVLILNSNLKQRNMVNKVKERTEKSRKKPIIRVIENIQIKPPRKEDKNLEKIEDKNDRETNMEWEENGKLLTDWNEEQEIEKKTEETTPKEND